MQMWLPAATLRLVAAGPLTFPLAWVFWDIGFCSFSTILLGVAGGLWDFSMMAVQERRMARRMVFWPGEAEGWEIAGCGDLIGD